MQVICIDDSKKPNQIPQEKWIKKGQIYTILSVTQMSIQRGKLGFKLVEIELDNSCFPYEYFSADRFLPVEQVEAPALHEELDLEHV